MAQTRQGGSKETHLEPLVHNPMRRPTSFSTSQDDVYMNVYFQTGTPTGVLKEDRQYVCRRPGVACQWLSTDFCVYGMTYWADQAKWFVCTGTDIMVYTSGTSTRIAGAFTVASTAPRVGFAEYADPTTGTQSMLVSNGAQLIQISTALAVTRCTDADLPTPHCSDIVVIDGYVLLAKTGTADVYNSDLGAPLSWTPGNFITAEMKGDNLKRLTQLQNYLVAVGTYSIEFLYDAAVPSGSPFQRSETLAKSVEYLSCLVCTGEVAYFVGRAVGSGIIQVYRLDPSKLEVISTDYVSQKLVNATAQAESGTIESRFGTLHTFAGMQFYLIAADSSTQPLLYNISNGTWTNLKVKGSFGNGPAVSYSANGMFTLDAYNSFGHTTAALYSWDYGSSKAGYDRLNYSGTTTDGTYESIILTDKFTFDSTDRKIMSQLTMVADRRANVMSGSVPDTTATNISVSWSDDDYYSFSTAVDLDLNQDSPTLRQLGSFRQRAFRFTYSGSKLFRLHGLEFTITRGAS